MWEATRIRTDGAPIRRGHGAVRQSSHLPPGDALVPRHRHGPINIGYNGMRGEPLEFENGPLGRSVERQTPVLALPGADRHNAPVELKIVPTQYGARGARDSPGLHVVRKRLSFADSGYRPAQLGIQNGADVEHYWGGGDGYPVHPTHFSIP